MLYWFRFILSVVLIVGCAPFCALAGPSHFDTSEDAYIYYDQNFNVVQRLRSEEKKKENLMSEEDKKPVSVGVFEADFESIKNNMTISNLAELTDLEKVKSPDGKIYIPCLESDRASWWLLMAKFGKPKYMTWGRKVLSRATYYIDPVGPTGGFFAKFVPHIPGLEQKVEREILVNDYVKSQLSELPENMRKLMIESFAGVNLSFFGVPFSVAYRSADRIRNKPDNIRAYPGHGLLGCDSCVQEYAMKLTGLQDAEKAIAKWKQEEYLPKLARYTAWTHHVLGASFESHTQNMVLDINHETGQIIQFYFRDFADVLLNPIPLLSDNRLPKDIQWEKVKLLSIHPNYFSDQDVQVAKDIWYHASIYSGQGITSHITGFPRQQRYLSIFLKNYISETEKILGQKIPLSEDAKKVLAGLDQRLSKDEFYGGELKDRSSLKNAMASVLKSVFEFAHTVKIEKVEAELKNAVESRNQQKLKKAFFHAMTLQRVIFMGIEEREMLLGKDTKVSWLKATIRAYLKFGFNLGKSNEDVEFKVFEDRIWAIDKESNKPIAAMIEPYRRNVSWMERVSSLFQSSKKSTVELIQCKQLFSGGGN